MMSAGIRRGLFTLLVICFGFATNGVRATDLKTLNADILQIAHAWAHIKFDGEDKDVQQKQIAALTDQAETLIEKYPGRAEPVIWQGILLSEGASMASEASSAFTARSLAYRARDILLKAEKMDPTALEAGAPTSLGVLYYRVPSFPLAFGDTDKARHYLEEAVRIAPDGLDANYFYGDFLMQQHDYPGAIRVWKHALSLPQHADRPLWDQSRRLVIQQALAKLSGGGS
jgi:tetratricopeptide (TPR) repeat protein